jgi:lipopolysaccharide biosynthesis glycosyltransferase
MTGAPVSALGRDPAIVCAADDAYALPLTVMVRSVLDNLDPSRRLRLFVIDGGLAPASRRRALASWNPERIEVSWIPVAGGGFAWLRNRSYLSPMTFERVRLGRLLPRELDRVLYLDCDLVVPGDVGELWDRDLGGALCLAVPDMPRPFIDAARILGDVAALVSRGLVARPIAGYERFALDPTASYLNAGVLLIDLAAWRRERVGERLLDCLEANHRAFPCQDQDALNAVLAGRWERLELRWNLAVDGWVHELWRQLPGGVEELQAAQEEPGVLHYWGSRKPWHLWRPSTPAQAVYDRYRRCTAWRGWPAGRVRIVAQLRMASRRLEKRTRRLQSVRRRLRRQLRRRSRPSTRSAPPPRGARCVRCGGRARIVGGGGLERVRAGPLEHRERVAVQAALQRAQRLGILARHGTRPLHGARQQLRSGRGRRASRGSRAPRPACRRRRRRGRRSRRPWGARRSAPARRAGRGRP